MKTDMSRTLKTILSPDRVEEGKDLFPYLTLRTGVKAQFFYEARTRNELITALKTVFHHGIPYLLIGGGSNIAVTKRTIPGLVIKNSYRGMEPAGEDDLAASVRIASGELMSVVVNETVRNGWEGFEYHKGLPGSVGGAVFMNSKWTRPWTYVGDNLKRAILLDREGNLREVDRDYFEFAYDWSILQKTHEVFIEGIFSLRKNDPAVLAKRADESLAYRKKTQPHGVATCGCFFRNIPVADKERLNLPTTSAGYLIDRAGMKRAQRGAFMVSDLHANFIVNTGNREGDSADLLQLIGDVKKKVADTFGVSLHEEVVII